MYVLIYPCSALHFPHSHTTRQTYGPWSVLSKSWQDIYVCPYCASCLILYVTPCVCVCVKYVIDRQRESVCIYVWMHVCMKRFVLQLNFLSETVLCKIVGGFLQVRFCVCVCVCVCERELCSIECSLYPIRWLQTGNESPLPINPSNLRTPRNGL